MYKALLSFFLLNVFVSISQDTTHLVSYPDGGYRLEIRTAFDTIYNTYYSKEKLESKIIRDKTSGKYIYKRFYWNGNRMWEKELKNGSEEGICTYFSKKGNKIGQFLYSKGEIVDTLFLAKNVHFVLGNMRFTSTVYGGIENEDGTSNVQHSEGSSQHTTMKFATIKNNQSDIPEEFLFTTDSEGDFIVIVKPGHLGLFDLETKTRELIVGQFLSSNSYNLSVHSSWNLTSPIRIDIKNQINIISLQHSFVGYAP